MRGLMSLSVNKEYNNDTYHYYYHRNDRRPSFVYYAKSGICLPDSAVSKKTAASALVDIAYAQKSTSSKTKNPDQRKKMASDIHSYYGCFDVCFHVW